MSNRLSSILLLLVILFVVLTVLVQSGVLLRSDLSITLGIQKVFPRVFDLPLSLLSLFGTVEIVSLFFLVLLLFSRNLNKLLVLSLYALTVLIELVGKSLITQNSPPLTLLRTHQFFDVPSGAISGHFFSYPSGHSSRTAFVSAFLLYIIWENKKISREWKYVLSIGVVMFDALMFFSRVYLGEHWITDVVGGAVLGFSLFLAGVFLSRRFSF